MHRLTINEKDKYITIRDYAEGKISRSQASIRLKIAPQSVSRLKNGYLKFGKEFFIHKNRGRKNCRHIAENIENEIVNLYTKRFEGFNFTHFYEMVVDNGLLSMVTKMNPPPCQKTVFRVLERNHITSPQANRCKSNKKAHPTRKRRASFGELVQIDGSLHDWFDNGQKWTLYMAIDDATSAIVGYHFEKYETTAGYLKMLEQIVKTYGFPKAFYTDRRTSFEYKKGVEDITRNVQFNRICKSFGTDVITTSIPQAKGRIERTFRTHQDRLVNELELHDIKTPEDVLKYLENYILRHNNKYAKPCENSVFYKVDDDIDLNKVISLEFERKVSKGRTISHKNKQYMPLIDGEKHILPEGISIKVVETLDETVYIKHNGEYYETIKVADYCSTAHTPPMEHPWKGASYEAMQRRKTMKK